MTGSRRRRRGTSIVAAVSTSALLLGLAACAPAPGPTAPPPDVTFELRQLRSDVADRTAQVRVVNGTDEPLEIVRVEFADSRFDGVAVRDRDSSIAPGRTVDLRIQLPPAACDDDGSAAASSVTLTLADGSSWRADIPDPLGFVPPLHSRECLLQNIDETAALAWSTFTPGVDSAVLTLAVTPAGGSSALVIDEVRDTNLIQFPGAAGTLPLDLPVHGGDAPFEIPVTIVPARCDPHAVMEDKRGTVFTVAVMLDGEEGTIDLATGEELRGRILAWVAQTCGYSSGE